ncbi:MAG: CoA ester lyase [Pseudomonadota bacterium]|jgi:citrate lyase subunit beta / citryl-CoA lyase|nr:CoA ester lyase [Pseudomonadota bacterium]
MIRSLLFVPADSEKKLAKAASCGADALILDLEDSVLPDRKPTARAMLRDYCAGPDTPGQLWVRVNDLRSGELLSDLVATVPLRPAGIVLPKLFGPEDLTRVSHYLDALEAQHELPPGGIRIMPVVTETPACVLRLGEMIGQPQPRLSHMTWGGEDLSAAMGAGDPRAEDGSWRPTYAFARTQCLLTAHAMGVEAIDTLYIDFRDTDGLMHACRESRHSGFTGRLAIHPNQVATINEAFTPTESERALAERIVEAFASGAGAVSIDGKMYDIPHLKAAERLLGSS